MLQTIQSSILKEVNFPQWQNHAFWCSILNDPQLHVVGRGTELLVRIMEQWVVRHMWCLILEKRVYTSLEAPPVS